MSSLDQENPDAWTRASRAVRNTGGVVTHPQNRQVGGEHYKILAIQPFDLTLANFGYQGLRHAVYTKVNKYLGRDKGDFAKHINDIEKAIHCLEIQLAAAKAQPKLGDKE